MNLYVEFHEKAEEEPTLEEEGRAAFRKLENGDQEAVDLWKWFRSESLKEFDKIYDMLGITFDSYKGEAFYEDKMDEIVELLEEKHLLKEDRGAEIVDLSAYDLNPALIKKNVMAVRFILRGIWQLLYIVSVLMTLRSLYMW